MNENMSRGRLPSPPITRTTINDLTLALNARLLLLSNDLARVYNQCYGEAPRLEEVIWNTIEVTGHMWIFHLWLNDKDKCLSMEHLRCLYARLQSLLHKTDVLAEQVLIIKAKPEIAWYNFISRVQMRLVEHTLLNVGHSMIEIATSTKELTRVLMG